MKTPIYALMMGPTIQSQRVDLNLKDGIDYEEEKRNDTYRRNATKFYSPV